MPNYWRIVGGTDKGGIIVREGNALASPQCKERLSTGAEVEELELIGDRLHFRRRTGSGPEEGWISTKVTGKVLAEPLDQPSARKPHQNAAPAHGFSPPPRDAGGPTEPAPEPAPAPAPAAAASEEPRWIGESRRKMEAFRKGEKFLPIEIDPKDLPERLKGEHPAKKMPPHKKLLPKEMAEMSVKNLPGHLSGMKFPHNAEQLASYGAEWYTQAFHKFGTLPKDNRVTRVVSVEQLPHSGFDAAGGAGHKALITLEYAKADPNLHTELFAKFPWDYFESDTGKTYRMQISSSGGDLDAPELLTYVCCEHLFPFRIPKLYFCDINRETTNYMLITERVPFGRRGRIEKGKVVEKIERKPYDVLPVCGKYQDYLLENPGHIYFCIFREMAHLAAWDQQGRYDYFLGPKPKYTVDEAFAAIGEKKAAKKQLALNMTKGAMLLVENGIDFALNIAPQVFTSRGRDPQMLAKMKEELARFIPFNEDIKGYCAASSDWVAAMHSNLQADNAFFWADEQGDLDAGVFDWCAFSRTPFVLNFMGCLSGADADFLDAHEEGLMKMFCDEYERYGGPHIEWQELLLRYRLQWPNYVVDCCRWVDRDILRECPKEEWSSIKTIYDSKFVDRWNVRCRGTALINAFEFWPRRNFAKIVDEWAAGPGKRFLTPYTL